MVVRKFNYVRFSIFIIILILIISLIVFGIIKIKKSVDYTKTYEYKFIKKGYSKEDCEIIEKALSNKEKEELLSSEYNPACIFFMREKYFIYDNLDKYIEYKRNNVKEDYSKVISIINTKADIDWFENEEETDTSKNELMLVNRLYGLSKEYKVEDITTIPVKYAYSNKKISSSILDSIISLIEDASENGYKFIVSEGFRSYEDQEKLYNGYVYSNGKSEADKKVARPGHSEYETGLSFDLIPYLNSSYNKGKESDEYKWLRENAYDYGFIFRFDEDKEYLTGFKADTWRLRYVGVDAASIIKKENICFEEYYAFYVK